MLEELESQLQEYTDASKGDPYRGGVEEIDTLIQRYFAQFDDLTPMDPRAYDAWAEWRETEHERITEASVERRLISTERLARGYSATKRLT